MRARTLGHFGGLLGLAVVAAGLDLGARATCQEPAGARPEIAEPDVAVLVASRAHGSERPTLVPAAPARRTLEARKTAAIASEDGGPVPRTWSVRVVGPDEEPVAGARLVVQFQRWGNTSYPHAVESEREMTSDARGLATLAVPDRASFARVAVNPPRGWLGPAPFETRRGDPVREAVLRAGLARSPAFRRLPRADVTREGDDRLGEVTVRLEHAATVSGRVHVPDGTSARRVVVTARWPAPAGLGPAACSIRCADDGTFEVPVPAGTSTVDLDAQAFEAGNATFPWALVSDGPPAVILSDRTVPPAYRCARARRSTDAEPPSCAPPAPLDLVPVRLDRVATGSWGLSLRLEPALRATLDIVDEDGRPARAPRIEVIDDRGRRARARTTGPPEGVVELAGLPAGAYELVASGDAGVARVPVRMPSSEATTVRLRRAEVRGRLAGLRDAADWYVAWRPDVASSPGWIQEVGPDGTWHLPVEASVSGRVVAWCDGPPDRAGWAQQESVTSGTGDVVLAVEAGVALAGRITGLPPRPYWHYRVHWVVDGCARRGDVDEAGAFALHGLPATAGALELWSGHDLIVRWPAVVSGRTEVVLPFPSADDASDREDTAAVVGLTPEGDGG